MSRMRCVYSNSRVTGRVDALATRQTKTLRPSPPLSGRPVRRGGEGQNDSLFLGPQHQNLTSEVTCERLLLLRTDVPAGVCNRRVTGRIIVSL